MDPELLNDEILNNLREEEKIETIVPRRNSKASLITKIEELAEKYNLDLPQSNSTLKKMSKKGLAELLANKMEEIIQIEISRKLNVPQELANNDSLLNLGLLQMLHNMSANLAEKGVNIVTDQFNLPYKIVGFVDSLKSQQAEIDKVLIEIAQDHPDLLDSFKSPYSRLMLIWSGALVYSLKKEKKENLNVREFSARELTENDAV